MAIGIETERKFIIRMPECSALCAEEGYQASEITQIYFASKDGVTHRVRRRAYKEKTSFTETKKTRISKMSVIEEEHELTAEEYESLLASHTVIGSLTKTRHIFLYGGHTIEIDIYPDWTRSCVLEVELASEDEGLTLPSYIEVLRDVTGSREYSNHTMSQKFPKEII